MNRVVVRIVCLTRTSTYLAVFGFMTIAVLILMRGTDDPAFSDLVNDALRKKHWRQVSELVARQAGAGVTTSWHLEEQGLSLPAGWKSEMSGKHPLVQVS